MSYDVSIGSAWFNYTYNVSALFYDHMDGGISGLNGLTGKQAGDKIAEAFTRLDRTRQDLWVVDAVGEPKFSAKYDAPNGWGSPIGGLMFLANIMAACYSNPRKKVHVG